MNKGRKLELLNKFNFSKQQKELLSVLLSAVDEKEIIEKLSEQIEDKYEQIEDKYQEKLVAGNNIKNINGESILGEGNISINTKMPIINHGISNTTYTLTPNVCHIWGTVNNLNLTLAVPEDNTIVNEYWFIFQSGATPTNVTLPIGLLWDSNIDTTSQFIEANTMYEFHICNGIVRVGGAV